MTDSENMIDNEELFHQIVHDLKSPLAAILGLSEVFLRVLAGNLNDNQQEVVRKIKGHTQFALSLVEDILDVENLRKGTLHVNKELYSIRAFLDDLVQDQAIVAEKKNIALSLSVPEDVNVKFDERYFRQILNNLVSNAIKFSYEGSKVEVYTENYQGNVYIKIRDYGMGISAEDQQQLFVPFSKLSNRPTADEKSTGLGLSIVKKLVEAHGGEVFVESIVGEGSTFIVKMPIDQGDSQE